MNDKHYMILLLITAVVVVILAVIVFSQEPKEPITDPNDLEYDPMGECYNGVTFYRFCGDRIIYEELQDVKRELKEIKEAMK